MRPWTALLPLFVVRWIALRTGERFIVDRHGRVAAMGPQGVLFMVRDERPEL